MGRAHPRRQVAAARLVAWLLAGSLALVGACGDDGGGGAGDAAATPVAITPGVGIGPVALGMRYGEVRALLGELPSPSQQNRIVTGRYAEPPIELVMTSASELELTDDAWVLALGAHGAASAYAGTPRPGQSRADIEAALGVAPEVIGTIHYYEAGITIDYGDGEVARAVGIVPPYALAPQPPVSGADR